MSYFLWTSQRKTEEQQRGSWRKTSLPTSWKNSFWYLGANHSEGKFWVKNVQKKVNDIRNIVFLKLCRAGFADEFYTWLTHISVGIVRKCGEMKIMTYHYMSRNLNQNLFGYIASSFMTCSQLYWTWFFLKNFFFMMKRLGEKLEFSVCHFKVLGPA